MPHTEVFLDNQRAVIAKHLSDAKSYVLVAMAYFTDAGLFNLLCKRAQEGIRVQLIVRDDETNILSGINYEKLNEINGYFAYDNKLHHKFCIIDGMTILSGSYNWTNQAVYNHEDLTVISDDLDTAYRFIVRFFTVKTTISPLRIKMIDNTNIDGERVLREMTNENREKRDSLSKRILERKMKALGLKPNNDQPT